MMMMMSLSLVGVTDWSLQATPCSPGSIPNKDGSSTPRYSHSMCKHVFNVKLAICSIHSCIHHHLYPNTEKNMGWMVSRLQHALLVAYQLIIIMCSTPVEFIQPMQTCIQREAVDLLYSFIHPPSHGLKKKRRYTGTEHFGLCPWSTLTQKIK